MTLLDDALRNVSRLGLDTSPFIYLIERHPTYLTRVRSVFRHVSSGVCIGVTSVITLTEVLTQPLRLGNTVIATRHRRFVTQSRNLALVAISAEIAERAASLRAQYNLRTPDALQLGTALVSGCQAFLTNDARLKHVTDLRVLVLDDLD